MAWRRFWEAFGAQVLVLLVPVLIYLASHFTNLRSLLWTVMN